MDLQPPPYLMRNGRMFWACLDKIKQECKPGSRIIFYYAGHGIADGADDEKERPKGFLLAVDSERGKEETYIEMGHVLEVLVGLPCSHLLIILDCCYAGAIRYAEQTRSIGSLVPKTLYAEKFTYYISNPAKQVITSAACDQKAMDALGSRGTLNANTNVLLLPKASSITWIRATRTGISGTYSRMALSLPQRWLFSGYGSKRQAL